MSNDRILIYLVQRIPLIGFAAGTEDYFNSANYFNAGEFRLPLTGFVLTCSLGDFFSKIEMVSGDFFSKKIFSKFSSRVVFGSGQQLCVRGCIPSHIHTTFICLTIPVHTYYLYRLTFKNESSYTMSAYRVHERDPVVFQKGIGLVWRNSDELPGSEGGGVAGGLTPPSWLCPITFPWYKNTTKSMKTHAHAPGEQALLDVEVTFMVWAYEWPRPSL